jgi:hypothetical protein
MCEIRYAIKTGGFSCSLYPEPSAFTHEAFIQGEVEKPENGLNLPFDYDLNIKPLCHGGGSGNQSRTWSRFF